MTAPANADLACSVYIDGTRLADTAADYLASVPTVLTGLSTTWGRASVIDQPDTSTCTFEIRDKGSDADFLGVLHVGHIVDVYSSAPTGTSVPTDVAEDGGFETTLPAQRVTASGATVTAIDDDESNTYFQVVTSGAGPGTVTIPPAPWGDAVGAWDGIPQVTVGESWTVTLDSVPGATQTGATLALALFGTPLRADPVATLATVPLSAGTTTVTAVIPEGHAIAWVGAVLTTQPGGPIWTAAVGTWLEQTLTWQEFYPSVNIDNLKVIAPAQARKRVSVFRGRITDLEASGNLRAVSMKVTAADLTADLANDAIGDIPWVVQTVQTRVARIRTLAATKFTADIDAGISPIQLTYRDVDSQPVMTLLSELAVTSDAVLWSAFEKTRGFYLWFEDLNERLSMSVLAWNEDHTFVIISGDFRPKDALVISACEMPVDAMAFHSNVTDVITRIDLTWQEQTVDDDGLPAPTERNLTLADTTAEIDYGIRRVGYTTQLVSEDDGTKIAGRVLARSRNIGWHAEGATWDLSIPAPTAELFDAALSVLDGASRIGMPLIITDLPEWTPSGDTLSFYLEGGTYTYDDGKWSLAMTLSPAEYLGASSQWGEVDATYRWIDLDPTIEWLDMLGVAGAPIPPPELAA